MNLKALKARGFDRSICIPFTNQYRVRCSACEALVINSMPCHENGCPNKMANCRECDAIIPLGQRYCEDCS